MVNLPAGHDGRSSLPFSSRVFQAFAYEVAAYRGSLSGTWEDRGDGDSVRAAFAWAQTADVFHVLGSAPLLGSEHHAVVPFSLRSAVLLVGDGRWLAGADDELGAWLEAHPAFRAVASRVAWAGRGGAASDRTLRHRAAAAAFEWAVQMRPIGHGHAHLVLRTTDDGTGGGLVELFTIIQMLRGAIPFALHEERTFLVDPLFASRAAEFLGLTPLSECAPKPPVHPSPVMRPPSVSYAPATGAAYVTLAEADRLLDAIALAHAAPPAATVTTSVGFTAPPSSPSTYGAGDYAERVEEAGRLFLRGKYNEFVAIWEVIAREFPEERGPALQQVGNGYYAMRDYARALHFYEQALAAGGELHDIRGDIANAQRKIR